MSEKSEQQKVAEETFRRILKANVDNYIKDAVREAIKPNTPEEDELAKMVEKALRKIANQASKSVRK